jgi:hypothetical protein
MNKRIEDTAYRPGGLAQPAQQSPHPEYDRGFSNGWDKCAERQALAQSEQEPVAWLRADGMKAMEADEKESWIEANLPELVAEYTVPLYTSPPQRQPLTDEQLPPIPSAYRDGVYLGYSQSDFKDYARAIEAAHGIGDKT